ncbi:MAG TPA: urease accessory protein UreD [Pseudolabrys sp.]|nr:urease accessory protein UreD [Pseudolabrys sp.]
MTRAALQETVFAANRAIGRVSLSVGRHDGRSRLGALREEGSLRVRFPNAMPDALEAVLVNTAGGIAGGDRFDIDLTLGEGTQLVAGTAAAEKIYRTHGPDAALSVRFDLGAGSRLAWLPQETILFNAARLARRIDIDLAGGASLVLAEAVVFGRAAMGETMVRGLLTDRWRLRRDGRLIFAETLRLNGGIAEQLTEAAIGGGAAAIATVVISPADDAQVEALRALTENFLGEVGISAWNGLALVRLCAKDGAALRHDLIMILAALKIALPRLWLN